MIIPLYDTTAKHIADKLISIRQEGGAIALSRVLTLLVPVGAADAEEAIRAANTASMEHPCRVIVLVERDPTGLPTLDAEIRVGGDAGASEVVVLRLRGSLIDQQASLITPLLLPDVPIVTWWPDRIPTRPATHPLGALADHRVTDTKKAPGPIGPKLRQLQNGYTPGDSDMSWTRITWWRAHLAAVLDRPPYEPITHAVIYCRYDHPSGDLLAAWLGWKLQCPVRLMRQTNVSSITRVELHRDSGPVVIDRPEGSQAAALEHPGGAAQRFHLLRRSLADCLGEELRRLGEDTLYGEVIREGLDWLDADDHFFQAWVDSSGQPLSDEQVAIIREAPSE